MDAHTARRRIPLVAARQLLDRNVGALPHALQLDHNAEAA